MMNYNLTLPAYEIWMDAGILNNSTIGTGNYQFYARVLTLGDVANLLRGINARNIGYENIKIAQVLDIETVMKLAQ